MAISEVAVTDRGATEGLHPAAKKDFGNLLSLPAKKGDVPNPGFCWV